MKDNTTKDISAARKEQFLAELPKCGGVLIAAIKAIGISAQCFYKWRRNDEAFRAKVEALLAEIRAKETLIIKPRVDTAQVRKWEKEIRESVNITLNDVPLLRRRLEYLSEVSFIHDMWSARAKASDCSSTILASYCSIAKVMATALKDMDDVIESIRARDKRRKTSFSITAAPSKERKIAKL